MTRLQLIALAVLASSAALAWADREIAWPAADKLPKNVVLHAAGKLDKQAVVEVKGPADKAVQILEIGDPKVPSHRYMLRGKVKYAGVKQVVPPVFYMPWRQDTHVGSMNFYVRSPQPETVLRALAGALKQVAPGVPMEDLRTMPEQIRQNVFLDRMISILSASFAFLATLLAAVGLYGVLAYTVAQRTREIGVRMALGADAGRVRTMVMRQVSGMMLVGGAIGLVGALGLGRAASSLLYGLEGHDPAVFVLAVLALLVVALGAAYLPARRASRVDPVQALRYE